VAVAVAIAAVAVVVTAKLAGNLRLIGKIIVLQSEFFVAFFRLAKPTFRSRKSNRFLVESKAC
jgi:hypothetical protein